MLFVTLFAPLVATISVFIQISVANPLAIFEQKHAKGSSLKFLNAEGPIALDGVLNNIGSAGSKAASAALGLVVASPSRSNPDYFYTWIKDTALTFKALVDAFIAGNSALQPQFGDCIYAQAQLQAVSNPSGSLSNGAGLGEPKFELDGIVFARAWGRPQRDDPALRATGLIAYSRWLLSNGGTTTVTSVIWPIFSNDLNYVAQFRNQTTFDLWEETDGSSFFTTAVQHRALVEEECSSYISQAPQILCFLHEYWNGQYIHANINEKNGRSC